MAKWDTFTILLKDHQLEEFLDKLELRAQGDPVKMKQIILDTAYEWTISKPEQGGKIVAKIIEVMTVDKVKNNMDS